MSKSIFLDTNSLILLSGIDEIDANRLSKEMEKNQIQIRITHVQIDEKISKEYSDYNEKIKKALTKLNANGIKVSVESTKEIIFDVSRFGMAKFGSKVISEIDSALRSTIKNCMGEKAKNTTNIPRDALIAVSSLNHDYFFTNDECLYKGWNIVIESNDENKKALQKEGFKIPQIIRRKTSESVLKAIIDLD